MKYLEFYCKFLIARYLRIINHWVWWFKFNLPDFLWRLCELVAFIIVPIYLIFLPFIHIFVIIRHRKTVDEIDLTEYDWKGKRIINKKEEEERRKALEKLTSSEPYDWKNDPTLNGYGKIAYECKPIEEKEEN